MELESTIGLLTEPDFEQHVFAAETVLERSEELANKLESDDTRQAVEK